jgi:thioredoxin 1
MEGAGAPPGGPPRPVLSQQCDVCSTGGPSGHVQGLSLDVAVGDAAQLEKECDDSSTGGGRTTGYAARVFEVTDDTFERDVLAANVPVVLDFWAPWCGPCRKVTPILEQLEGELRGRVEFAKVNVDENPQVAARYGVLSLPTAIVFADGEARATLVGARPRKHYERALGAWR